MTRCPALQIKGDANTMLAALDTDELLRAASAGAGVMGGALGQMIVAGLIEPGRINEVFAGLIEIAEEFARAEAMA